MFNPAAFIVNEKAGAHKSIISQHIASSAKHTMVAEHMDMFSVQKHTSCWGKCWCGSWVTNASSGYSICKCSVYDDAA